MDEDPELLDVAGIELRLDRLTYSTVALMSVLIVYDGWQALATFFGTALVVLAPVLALTLAHLFAEVVQAHAALARPLRRDEWVALVREQVPDLLAGVPPLLVLGAGWISRLDALQTIQLLVWTGLVTLIGLAAVAGVRAGFRSWRLVAVALAGGGVGLIVILLQVVLKPH